MRLARLKLEPPSVAKTHTVETTMPPLACMATSPTSFFRKRRFIATSGKDFGVSPFFCHLLVIDGLKSKKKD